MDPSASRLLDAIRAFEQEHQHDPQFRPLLDALHEVAAEVSKIPGAAAQESPGMRAAREAGAERAAPPMPGPPAPAGA